MAMTYIEGGKMTMHLDRATDSNLDIIAKSLDKIAKHLEHIDEVLTESKTKKRRKRRTEE